MTKLLKFEISGYATVDIEDVVFFDHAGEPVDTSGLSLEELQTKLAELEIDFDWVSLLPNGGFNAQIEDVRIEEEE
jgi:hypothetical protein